MREWSGRREEGRRARVDCLLCRQLALHVDPGLHLLLRDDGAVLRDQLVEHPADGVRDGPQRVHDEPHEPRERGGDPELGRPGEDSRGQDLADQEDGGDRDEHGRQRVEHLVQEERERLIRYRVQEQQSDEELVVRFVLDEWQQPRGVVLLGRGAAPNFYAQVDLLERHDAHRQAGRARRSTHAHQRTKGKDQGVAESLLVLLRAARELSAERCDVRVGDVRSEGGDAALRHICRATHYYSSIYDNGTVIPTCRTCV